MSEGAQSVNVDLPAQPRMPRVPVVEPADGWKPPEGVPVTRLRGGETIVDWLIAGPVAGQRKLEDAFFHACGPDLARLALGPALNHAGQALTLERIRPDWIRDGAMPRVDLGALGGDKKEEPVTVALYGAIENAEDRVVRVRLDRLGARMWLGGTAVHEGGWIRLRRGIYPALVVADTVRDYGWDHLFVAPRLVPFAEEDTERLYRLRLRQWEQGQKALAGNAARETAAVRFDPTTLKGKKGFFRVGRSVHGVWWFLTPDDKPFYFKGVCGVNRAGTAGGRRAVPGPYAEVVDRKYDYPKTPKRFVESTIRRLRSWGFNALGSWVTEEFFEQGMPYTDIVEFFHEEPRLERGRAPDVFHPAWAENVRAKAARLCAPQKNNRWLVGYFLDNERGYPAVDGPGSEVCVEAPVSAEVRPCLLQVCLSEKAGAPAHEAAWSFVLARHGNSMEAAGKAWGIPLGSREAIREATDRDEGLMGKAFRADAEAFAVHFFKTYLRIGCEAVRGEDPNHLILGCRWGGPPHPAVLAAEREHVDVRSFNTYQDMVYERAEEYLAGGEMPTMIGEFNYMDDSHMFIAMPFEAPGGYTPVERARIKGTAAFRHAFRHPCLVGYTWYRWVCHNPRKSVRSYGMVTYDDDPIESNLRTLALANVQAEDLRAAAETPGTSDCRGLSGDLTVSLLWGAAKREGPFARRRKLVFGVRMRDGVALPEVTGHGVRGRAEGAVADGKSLRLTVDVELLPVVLPQGEGAGRYEVRLTRNGDHFSGGYSGACNGISVSGSVSAWIA